MVPGSFQFSVWQGNTNDQRDRARRMRLVSSSFSQPEPTRDQDLRELIARRREEKGMMGKRHAKREREEVRGRGTEVEEGGKATVSSVVKLVER